MRNTTPLWLPIAFVSTALAFLPCTACGAADDGGKGAEKEKKRIKKQRRKVQKEKEDGKLIEKC
jgi:hypothetical protein